MKIVMRTLHISLVALFLAAAAFGQRTEISISLSEHFFDTVLDAVYMHSQPPKFSIAGSFSPYADADSVRPAFLNAGYFLSGGSRDSDVCDESITLQRENSGIRTSVRFRDGQIFAPMAFSGNYNPPLVGCMSFAGWAESNIELGFDQDGQRLIARAKVTNVTLNGTGGVGSSLIARMVQSSIDRRINPIEIIRLDKISLMLPLQNSANIKMQAVGIRHEIQNERLVIHIVYEFQKV